MTALQAHSPLQVKKKKKWWWWGKEGWAGQHENPKLAVVTPKEFSRQAKNGKRKQKRQWRREEGRGPPAPPGAPGTRTYLLAAAAGVGLGVRRRAAAAPGRGVKVPGIILVHDPRWGPERKRCFSSPALAAAAHRLLRARSLPAAPRALVFAPGLLPDGGGFGREAATAREPCLPSASRCTSSLLSERRGTRGPPSPSL